MPSNKDQKRLIRARMKKTGESYTAARRIIIARGPARSTKTAGTEWARETPDMAELAGVSDAAVEARTGLTWPQWVSVLDAAGAREMSHRDIARHIVSIHGEIGGWWAQTATVGYERIRGLRDIGQRRGGLYEANKSRTLPVGVSTLYRTARDVRRRKAWLPEGVTKVRTAVVEKSIRCDWQDGTRVAMYFVPKGPRKSLIAIQHQKLVGRGDVARRKAFWGDRLDALTSILAADRWRS